uniref:Mediator complex subunit Med12 domain-containing protein n=1 Tax=Auxenochlorella protothecoides TaxID=3075 RepID=A0A1D1ZVF9_AUXPR
MLSRKNSSILTEEQSFPGGALQGYFPHSKDCLEEALTPDTLLHGYSVSYQQPLGIDRSAELCLSVLDEAPEGRCLHGRDLAAMQEDMMRMLRAAREQDTRRRRRAEAAFDAPLCQAPPRPAPLPSQVAMGDAARRAWLAALAGSCPLGSLAAQGVPHGLGKGQLWEALAEAGVPLPRALWLVRVVYLQRSRPLSAGKQAQPSEGAAALVRGARCADDLASHLDSLRGGGGPAWAYCLRLAGCLAAEGLADAPALAAWAARCARGAGAPLAVRAAAPALLPCVRRALRAWPAQHAALRAMLGTLCAAAAELEAREGEGGPMLAGMFWREAGLLLAAHRPAFLPWDGGPPGARESMATAGGPRVASALRALEEERRGLTAGVQVSVLRWTEDGAHRIMDAALDCGVTGPAVRALVDLLGPVAEEGEGLACLAGLVCDWATADPVAEAWAALGDGLGVSKTEDGQEHADDPACIRRATHNMRARRMLCAAGMLREAAAALPAARLTVAVSAWVAGACRAGPPAPALVDWAALLVSHGSFCPASHLDALLATGRLEEGGGHRAFLAELPPALLRAEDRDGTLASRYRALWTHLAGAGSGEGKEPLHASSGELDAFMGTAEEQDQLDAEEAELDALQAGLLPWLAVPAWGGEGKSAHVCDWAAALARLASARPWQKRRVAEWLGRTIATGPLPMGTEADHAGERWLLGLLGALRAADGAREAAQLLPRLAAPPLQALALALAAAGSQARRLGGAELRGLHDAARAPLLCLLLALLGALRPELQAEGLGPRMLRMLTAGLWRVPGSSPDRPRLQAEVCAGLLTLARELVAGGGEDAGVQAWLAEARSRQGTGHWVLGCLTDAAAAQEGGGGAGGSPSLEAILGGELRARCEADVPHGVRAAEEILIAGSGLTALRPGMSADAVAALSPVAAAACLGAPGLASALERAVDGGAGVDRAELLLALLGAIGADARGALPEAEPATLQARLLEHLAPANSPLVTLLLDTLGLLGGGGRATTLASSAPPLLPSLLRALRSRPPPSAVGLALLCLQRGEGQGAGLLDALQADLVDARGQTGRGQVLAALLCLSRTGAPRQRAFAEALLSGLERAAGEGRGADVLTGRVGPMLEALLPLLPLVYQDRAPEAARNLRARALRACCTLAPALAAVPGSNARGLGRRTMAVAQALLMGGWAPWLRGDAERKLRDVQPYEGSRALAADLQARNMPKRLRACLLAMLPMPPPSAGLMELPGSENGAPLLVDPWTLIDSGWKAGPRTAALEPWSAAEAPPPAPNPPAWLEGCIRRERGVRELQ